jgi:hypothetical protein
MKFTQDQIDAMGEAAAQAFEDRAVGYLREGFPEECDAMGEAEVRDWIRYGISRAESYDIESKSDLCVYLGVMFAFGRDFDVDPAIPWAEEILNGLEEPEERMSMLYEAALESLGDTDDDDDEAADV